MNSASTNSDYGQAYEQLLHPGDPKIFVYSANDVEMFCAMYPDAVARLRGMPVFKVAGDMYLNRGEVWKRLGCPKQDSLLCEVQLADPRCDQWRMSQMQPVGQFTI